MAEQDSLYLQQQQQNWTVEYNFKIPPNVKPGQRMQVQTDRGMVQVVLPNNAKPGRKFKFTLTMQGPPECRG